MLQFQPSKSSWPQLSHATIAASISQVESHDKNAKKQLSKLIGSGCFPENMYLKNNFSSTLA